MARSRYGFDEAKIARLLNEGRGKGRGADYKPWLTVQDVPSRGRSHRFAGRTTARVHHLLSDIEYRTLLIYEWCDAVVDIRERFPLDRTATTRIAAAIGVAHPADPKSGVDLVMTTDLLIDFTDRVVARAVKPSSDLDKARTLEKLEIERRVWSEQGVDWGVVTERELPDSIIANLQRLAGYRDVDDRVAPERIDLIEREHAEWSDALLRDFCLAMDARHGLEAGGALEIVLHLIAIKRWIADVTAPIDGETPLWRFTRRDGQARRDSA
ncbi:TnsA endonuclease N-terminal domain-containing protein [Rubrimonas cliftonensis]|uniref:TnsA endonuclease C terminal n=1 Tax=Rubrimonas cliftonensis TaxID=89524 RepID=A0A1H4CT91_9RHOB|nr:TnsA endonuclease N-terminal domain-containing protein [Rubrimonas cliftonensis]SEA63539.1 TnsA endonuclease C terminal [Rubrimonas cliftonensis]